MTLAELWELFPIALVPPDERWESYYREMHALLEGALAKWPEKRIGHIGSTAIKGIRAKNIVDILVELPSGSDMNCAAGKISECGFIEMSAGKNRMSFNKGYTKHGFADRVYHLHLRYEGDNDELYFRDYLNDHPGVAAEYEALKLRLQRRYEHDRDAYTNAKTDFVEKCTLAAREEYRERYRRFNRARSGRP